MSKNLILPIVFIVLISCKKEIPKIDINAKTNEITSTRPIDRSNYRNYSYMVDKKKLNGHLSSYTHYNELIQYGGYIEGKKYGEHKHYYGKDDLLYKIKYDENVIIDQTINVFDLKGNLLYEVTYKDGKPVEYNEKQKIELPKQLKDKIILNGNRWFIVNSSFASGDFNSDGIKDFALKYRDDYKYKFVAFISNPRTKTWRTIFQNDNKSKEVLKYGFGNEDSPLSIYPEKIEGLDCLNDGDGTIIYFDEVINAFQYYRYD